MFNPFATPFPFTLLIYDSPTFITTDITVDVAQLAFRNPANTIASVQFRPSSCGVSELDVFQSGGGADQTFNGNQFRYYTLGHSTSTVSPRVSTTLPALPTSACRTRC